MALYSRRCQHPGSSAGILPHLRTKEPPWAVTTDVRIGRKWQESHFLDTKLTEREWLLLCKCPSLTDDRDFCSEARSLRPQRGHLRPPPSPCSPSLCPQLQEDPGRPGLHSAARVHLGLRPAGCSPPSGHGISHHGQTSTQKRDGTKRGSLTLITRYRGGSLAILVNSFASSLNVGRTFSSTIQPGHSKHRKSIDGRFALSALPEKSLTHSKGDRCTHTSPWPYRRRWCKFEAARAVRLSPGDQKRPVGARCCTALLRRTSSPTRSHLNKRNMEAQTFFTVLNSSQAPDLCSFPTHHSSRHHSDACIYGTGCSLKPSI